MKKRSSVQFGLLTVMIAVLMISVTLFHAGASTIPEDEINALVNTVTDASQVTSPFIQVASKVRNSVVGVNNYTSSTYYSYGFGYGAAKVKSGNPFPAPAPAW